MESSSDYITGGTLTATVDKWSSRVFKKDADTSGIWDGMVELSNPSG
jgi:hypothetical protein